MTYGRPDWPCSCPALLPPVGHLLNGLQVHLERGSIQHRHTRVQPTHAHERGALVRFATATCVAAPCPPLAAGFLVLVLMVLMVVMVVVPMMRAPLLVLLLASLLHVFRQAQGSKRQG